MLKYIGFVIISFCSFLLFSEYKKKSDKRLAELNDFLRFFNSLSLEISCFLRPVSECAAAFKADSREVEAILNIQNKKTSLEESFMSLKDTLSLKSGEINLLSSLFSRLGKSYMDEEKAFIKQGAAELCELVRAAEGEAPKNIKIAATLSASVAIGIIFFLI